MSFFKRVAAFFGGGEEGDHAPSGSPDNSAPEGPADGGEGELDPILTEGLTSLVGIASDAERAAACTARFETPAFHEALEALSEQDPGRAVALLRRYEAVATEHLMVSLWLGRLYDARRDDEAARAVLARLAEGGPHAAEANERLGRIAERQGLGEQALIFYQRALLEEWGRPGLVDACARLEAHLPEPAPAPLVIIAHEPPPGFEITHPLGRGGYGTVYLGRDVALDRRVALKFLHPFLRRAPHRVEDFFREARVVASLNDPGVVRIYDIDPERHLIVMEYVDDGTLADRLSSTRGIHPEAALTCVRDLCTTLELVHGRGLVHRDIKPANVLFRRGGDAVLGDFGIAALEEGEQLAASTRRYAPPELMAEGRADRRADVYGLGLLLGAMLTGEPPPEEATEREIWLATAAHVFDDEIAPGVGQWLGSLTASSPGDRPGSVEIVDQRCALLVRALRGEGPARGAVMTWPTS